MKNIFEYVLAEDGILNEDVFESFAYWMFDGDDLTNQLSRIYLRWSIMYIARNIPGKTPHNDDFYSFFQAFDRTDFNSFLNHLSKDAAIAGLVEDTLGSDQITGHNGDYQTTYWYFIGIIKEHVDNRNLFPEEVEVKSNVLKFDTGKAKADRTEQEKEPLSEFDQKKVADIFSIILAVLVAAFLFINLVL